MIRFFLLAVACAGFPASCLLQSINAAVPAKQTDFAPQLAQYDQGGVVVDGIAYFTGSDRAGDFPHVAAFDVDSLQRLRTYQFSKTYDSTPLLFQKRDGSWLIVAHEHVKKRTVARNRDTGEVEWISSANQPGNYFFGYSYFNRSFYAETQNGPDASQILRIEASSGRLLEVYDYSRPLTSCAQCIIARGRILSGDLHEHRLVVTRIAENSKADWPGPFGHPQTNHMAVGSEKDARLVPMSECGAKQR